MTSRFRFVVVAALAGFACGDSVAGPSGTVVIEPIEIQSVELTVGATRPALVTARVRGTLGSGCAYVHSIEQRREAAAVTIEIKRSRFVPGPCTAILKQFAEEPGLPGEFDAGEYTVHVNGLTRTFSVP
ncbi:MAG TPA: hypothetical protein VGQ66_02530 [Candidatus Limnocylindria bacterium]|nr:hypothetical protein [Candidatus Limnocylindria bacterium]